MSALTDLSVLAHNQAIRRGTLTPAERYEFSHLPMKRVEGGVPAFDASRMRPDQVDETVARLERITGKVHAWSVRDSVEAYMNSYGRFGLRVQDICESLSASKKPVLKYLRELIDAGKVYVKEETTRGTGSKRKRYFWVKSETHKFQETPEGVQLIVDQGRPHGPAEPGIIHHGASVYGLVCPCGWCEIALEDALEGEERSAARRNGETGLRVGLEARRVRREALEQWERDVIAAAGLAA